jgi:hypothetical protein
MDQIEQGRGREGRRYERRERGKDTNGLVRAGVRRTSWRAHSDVDLVVDRSSSLKKVPVEWTGR